MANDQRLQGDFTQEDHAQLLASLAAFSDVVSRQHKVAPQNVTAQQVQQTIENMWAPEHRAELYRNAEELMVELDMIATAIRAPQGHGKWGAVAPSHRQSVEPQPSLREAHQVEGRPSHPLFQDADGIGAPFADAIRQNAAGKTPAYKLAQKLAATLRERLMPQPSQVALEHEKEYNYVVKAAPPRPSGM